MTPHVPARPEPVDLLRLRTHDFTLAALATAYPAPDLVDVLGELEGDLSAHPGLGPLVGDLAGDATAVQSRYLQRFDAGADRVALYETEYGRMRGLSKGNDLADIVGFYRAFGFDLEDGPDAELPDHLAVQLEFYAILLYKSQLLVASGDQEGQEILVDARRKFLEAHLGRFVRTVAATPPIAADPVYGPLLAWTAGIVDDECARVGARPAPLDFFAQDDVSEVANCGGCVAIPGLGSDKACP